MAARNLRLASSLSTADHPPRRLRHRKDRVPSPREALVTGAAKILFTLTVPITITG